MAANSDEGPVTLSTLSFSEESPQAHFEGFLQTGTTDLMKMMAILFILQQLYHETVAD